MFKPTQKFIDNCLMLWRGEYRGIKPNEITPEDIKKLVKDNFFDGADLSDPMIVDTLQDLIFSKRLKNIDLSDIKIPYAQFMSGFFSHDMPGIESWTDTVIWPKDIEIEPNKILNDNKYQPEMDLVHNKATGKNIGIAIIDQRLNIEHPEYKNRIKHYETVGLWPNNDSTTPDYHGSLVMGCGVGKDTGTAPDADIYYFAANNWVVENKFLDAEIKMTGQEPLRPKHRKFFNLAIQRVLELNKSLPENKKIRFLSCSWGSKTDQFRKESDELFAECEKNGIMVIGGFYNLDKAKTIQCDKNLPNKTNLVGIPTDGKTTPYFQGGYIYKRLGGASSTCPYIAGVFACACQNNQIFFTRPNWQDELWKILSDTAKESEHGGKIINPIGIVERVTQIAREMEMNLIKQNGNQHE